MNQHERIIALCQDGAWYCQAAFHPISWCPHKRRAEILKKREYQYPDNTPMYSWDERPCEHGIPGSKDYRLIRLRYSPIPPQRQEEEVEPKPPKLF